MLMVKDIYHVATCLLILYHKILVIYWLHVSTYFSDGPRINMSMNSFTVEEGMILLIPLSIDANPQPDPFTLHYQNLNISIAANSSFIEFSKTSRNQAGNYTLTISNNISTVMYTFTIDVTCEL